MMNEQFKTGSLIVARFLFNRSTFIQKNLLSYIRKKKSIFYNQK